MTREQFIQGYENWDSYKPLLWEGLERTDGDVIEMGVGKGSTLLLHDYTFEKQRELYSYESNPAWLEKFEYLTSRHHTLSDVGMGFNFDWGIVHEWHRQVGLVFIDHAPGERRKVDIALFANKAQIIVAHDTEPNADHGYQMRDEIKKFKYWRDFETPGAWASIMSNFVDVTKSI